MVRVKVSRNAIDNLQNAKERYDKFSEIQKKLSSPPPSGLIPIGDTGLYRTPDVISPKDCEFYPDSPYCGGNPLTRDSIGLDLDWGVDGCSIHASVTPKLGFMKLPTHTLAYVREECREDYEKKQNSIPAPPDWTSDEVPKPNYRPTGFRENDWVCAVTIKHTFRETQEYQFDLGEWAVATSIAKPSVKTVNYPGTIQVPNYFPPHALRDAQADIDAEVFTSIVINEAWAIGVNNDYNNTVPRSTTETIIWQRGLPQDMPTVFVGNYGNWDRNKSDGNFAYIGQSITGSGEFIRFHVGRFGSIFPSAQLDYDYGVQNDSISRNKYAVVWSCVFCKKLDGKPSPPFIPPNTRKRECCMTCCSSQTGQGTQRQQQDLEEIKKMLRQILKNQGTYPFSVTLYDTDDNKPEAQTKNVSVADQAKAQKLIVEREEKNAKSIGIDQFPIYVPSSIVEDRSNGLLGDIGNVKNKIFKQRIESIAELLTWKIGNDREIFGAWQEYIDIQDSDPEKKGNQPKRVVLPNMARSFRELVLLNSVQIKTTGLLLDAVLKMYIDIANTKVSSAVTEAIVRDIQGFLDYPTDEKPLNVPLGIKIPSDNDSPDDKEDIKRFLSNSTVKANFDDWTGEGSLHDLMITLLDAAAMIRAAFFNKG